MPAGKADFDGRLIDVIAEGLPIERGQAVVVTKARGNRVMVRAADARAMNLKLLDKLGLAG